MKLKLLCDGNFEGTRGEGLRLGRRWLDGDGAEAKCCATWRFGPKRLARVLRVGRIENGLGRCLLLLMTQGDP